jgi:hypothetical protein
MPWGRAWAIGVAGSIAIASAAATSTTEIV